VLHQIGVGALGPVFRTYEPTRDRLVAVKVFRLDLIPEQARALADELARAADAGLFHPSIVEPVAAGLEGTVAYRAEEYVAAESLDVAMRHYAPATVDKVLPFITQLAAALDFARAAGVGHGALHPRDIFVTPDEARATGFGVVDALDRLGLRAPVRRPYSPPERIAGQAWGTPADIFSLGVIAFELLTGRRPAGLGQEMGPLGGATLGARADDVRAVLARAMHEDPSERYATARAFSAALAHAADVPETMVSLATQGVNGLATPAADPVLRVAPSEPAGVETELPLSVPAPAAQPASDVMIQTADARLEAATDVPEMPDMSETTTPDTDRALDDFAAEPEGLLPGDSAREVARKMIAAREIRKRQVRKGESELVSKGSPEAVPVAGALFDAVRADTPVEASLNAIEHAHADADAAKDSPDVEETEVPTLEAVDLTPAARDLSDRVVAVDEFRAREAASPKPDRGWGRVPERIGLERTPLDQPERILATKVGAIGSIDPDIPPPAFGEPAERERLVMLPVALWVSLGLVLGYGAGYVVGNREKPSSVQGATTDTPASSAEAQTPGTTGRTPAKETTLQVVPPESARGVSSEATPSVTATPPAAAPAPSAPSPREARPVATVGRLVITSNPAKAAVTVNGKWSGRTPLTIDDLKFGKYVVRVVEPGYQVARNEINLSPSSASRTVDVTLRREPTSKRVPAPEARAPQAQSAAPSKPPAAATGEIFVDSRPRGARVFIDGKELGVTPLRLTGQPLSPHVVRLELADHQSWTSTARVIPQDVARVTGSLDRIR